MRIHRDTQIDIGMGHFKILVSTINGNKPDIKLGLSSTMFPQY